MHAYLQLMRIANCAMAAFAAVIGVLLAFRIIFEQPLQAFPFFEAGSVGIAVMLVTGAGNTINDYFDVGIDTINRPDRPIPSGKVSKQQALFFAAFLFIAGIAIAGFINLVCALIALFNSLLLVLYARNLKATPFFGNAAVGYLTGSTFLFGAAVFGMEGLYALSVLFLLATLATIAREIVKDIEDMEGDLKAGATTLPVLIGKKQAGFVASALALIGIAVSPYPYMNSMLGEYYLPLVGIADLLFIAGVYAVLKNDPALSSKRFKLAMFMALFAFVAGA
jgi:geranylgeranylglycerol-phosphate geranylgeranyltransferase